MVRTPRRLTAGALVIGALATGSLLAGCSKSTPAGGTATLPTAPPTTADPWAVPATITPDYLNRVLAKLNQIDGDAKRDSRTAGTITPTFTRLESSIRASSAEVQLVTVDWQKNVTAGFADIRPSPGDRRFEVKRIVALKPCVLAEVSADFTAVTAGAPRIYPPWFVGLTERSPTQTNPTRWVLAYDGFQRDGGTPDPTQACAVT